MSCLTIEVTNKTPNRLNVQVSHVCRVTEGYVVLFASDCKLVTTDGETIYKKR